VNDTVAVREVHLKEPDEAPLTLASQAVRVAVAALPVLLLALSLFTFGRQELMAFAPEIALIGAAMMFPLAPRRMSTNRDLVIGAVAAIGGAIFLTADQLLADVYGYGGFPMLGASSTSVAGGALVVDAFSMVFSLIFLFAGLMVAVASYSPEIERTPYQGIYFSLLMLTLVGTMVVAAAGSLLTIFLGLELAGIATYAMVAFTKHNKLSTEAAVKYYIIGSVSTGLLLFGLSYLYGMTGSLDIHTIASRLAGADPASAGVVLATVFLLAGFGFKMAAVPFHLWAPDTYTGAPSPVSALLAAGTKKMGFAAAFKVIVIGMVAVRAEWSVAFAIIAVLTMTVGNTAAVLQSNYKRMLAYSSITHAGYIIMALAVAGATATSAETAVASGIFHSLTHMVMTAAAFIAAGIFLWLQVGDNIDDLRGLGRREPVLGFALLIILFSLIGFPPLVGFWSKYFIGKAAVDAGGWFVYLAIALLFNSVYSAYYYVRVLRVMYTEDPDKDAPPLRVPRHMQAIMVATMVFVILAGLFPEPLFNLSLEASRALLGGG
jgi:NADH-quinone oxidoreductase subunit N